MSVWGQSGIYLSHDWDYVQTAEPANPQTGETWYDPENSAGQAYDGSGWVDVSVADHSQLSGINSGDHHARYSDSEAVAATDGVIDAATVGGQTAGDLATPVSTESASNTKTFQPDWTISSGETESRAIAGHAKYLKYTAFGDGPFEGTIRVSGLFNEVVYSDNISFGSSGFAAVTNTHTFDVPEPVYGIELSSPAGYNGSLSLDEVVVARLPEHQHTLP